MQYSKEKIALSKCWVLAEGCALVLILPHNWLITAGTRMPDSVEFCSVLQTSSNAFLFSIVMQVNGASNGNGTNLSKTIVSHHGT